MKNWLSVFSIIAVILMLGSGCTTIEPIAENSPQKQVKPNVILIHGFGNIVAPGTDLVKWGMTEFYWGRWVEEAFSDVETKYIYWDSTKRIEQQLGDIVDQFNSHLEAGHCPVGCLVFTHSTGGLVIDVLMSRAYESRGRMNDFSQIWDKTIASVNIASAAGGVGLATILTDLVMGSCNVVLESLFSFIECGKPASMGTGHDLRPDEARFINHSDNVRTPSLMIAGFGLMMPDFIRLSLFGTNDGLVAMHSACGGNSFPISEEEAPESCSPILAPDGEVKPQKAPDLYRNHYPVIMTKEGHVSQLRRGLLNIDFISTKTETLVFYENSGAIGRQIPQKFSGVKTLNVNHNSSHLSDIVGDYFDLRAEHLSDSSNNPGVLSREDFHSNLLAISKSFERSLEYPLYSRPLFWQDHALLNSNESNTIYRDFNKNSYTAAIILPQYVMFRESVVPITFRVVQSKDKALPEIEYVKGEIISGEGTVTNEFDLQLTASKSSELLYKIDFMPSETDYSQWSPEVNLKISFKPKGKKKETLTKMFKVVTSIASITDKGQERVEGPNLVIPLDLEVKQPGYYRVTGNLFSRETGQPIAHLIGEEPAVDFNGTIMLKVYSKVLKEKNESGPYLLKDIMITRLPDSFEEPRQFGDASGQQFEIEGFELNLYSEKTVTVEYEQSKLKQFQHFVNSLVEE
ncbi:hypothetical protein KJ966_07510 [bacterium]|nr:hypothetical protein [bacterium]